MEPYKNILITGSACFIGYSLSYELLQTDINVIGIDSISDYYDINLKRERHNILKKNKNFHSWCQMSKHLSLRTPCIS